MWTGVVIRGVGVRIGIGRGSWGRGCMQERKGGKGVGGREGGR